LAIAAWIEARDMERRVSFDPRSREADRMHQFVAFVNTGFTAAFSPLWVALEMKSGDPSVLKTLRDFGRKAVAARHDKLEAMIGETDFLVGDRLTLADTTLIGVARWAELHQAIDGGAYVKLAALRRRIEADPAVRYAKAIEDGETPAGSGACLGQVPLAEVLARFKA
jgi:glutathione S-transferase